VTDADLPVADRWFTAEPRDHGITWITEPHVDPFIRCNIWHVRGRDHDLLIDTGLGLRSLVAELPEVFTGRSTIAVATHYHYDHVGGHEEFAERWIHESEAETVRSAAAIGGALTTSTWPASSLAAIQEAGYVLPDDGELLVALPSEGYDRHAFAATPFVPTRTLADGDVIDLGDRTFEVLHLPGHSPGSVGLWDAERGVLFSGDAVYDGPLLDEGSDSDVDAYLATMDRLAALPVEVVHGGHEASFGRSRLVELCRGYQERRRPR
jgi:glyoxylase-like metal-dependent hydrolase (beta-lactamase superfamily II)